MQTKPRWWVRTPYFFIEEPTRRADIVLHIGNIETNATIADVFSSEQEAWQIAEKYILGQIARENEILSIDRLHPFHQVRHYERLVRAEKALTICQEALSTKA